MECFGLVDQVLVAEPIDPEILTAGSNRRVLADQEAG